MQQDHCNIFKKITVSIFAVFVFSALWDSAFGLKHTGGSFRLVNAAKAQTVTIPMNELLSTDSLKEMSIGHEDAPVTIIEYSSMTCGACAQFSNIMMPKLKEKYIETGKVRFILRQFPLDPLAAAAAILSRCVEDKHHFDMVETLLSRQAEWIRTKNPKESLFMIAKHAGLTRQKFDACMSSQKLLDGINQVKKKASEKFKVNSTPTIFINGKLFPELFSFDKLEQALGLYLNAQTD